MEVDLKRFNAGDHFRTTRKMNRKQTPKFKI